MRLKKAVLDQRIAGRNMTYKQAAQLAGVTEKTLRAARIGKEIRPVTAGSIARALDIDVSELLVQDQH